MEPLSAIILAGGKNSRMNGLNKARLKVDGLTVLDRTLAVLRPLSDDILIVANDPLAFADLDMFIATDVIREPGSLSGIHAGLFYARHSHALAVSCDMPFLDPEMLDCVLSRAEPKFDVVIPKTSLGMEPLCAVYSKRCVPFIQKRLQQKKMRISGFFDAVRVKTIPESTLRGADPELRSFFNINTPEQLEFAAIMATEKDSPSCLI